MQSPQTHVQEAVWESNRKERKSPSPHQRGELEHFCRSAGLVEGRVRGGFAKSSLGEEQSRLSILERRAGPGGGTWSPHSLSLEGYQTFQKKSFRCQEFVGALNLFVSWISQMGAVGC